VTALGTNRCVHDRALGYTLGPLMYTWGNIYVALALQVRHYFCINMMQNLKRDTLSHFNLKTRSVSYRTGVIQSTLTSIWPHTTHSVNIYNKGRTLRCYLSYSANQIFRPYTKNADQTFPKSPRLGRPIWCTVNTHERAKI